MQTAEPIIIVEAEVQALILQNTFGGDAIIYTDGFVIRHVKSSWDYTAQVGGKTVREYSGAFALTTSGMTMEIMAVTRAIAWLCIQTFALTTRSITIEIMAVTRAIAWLYTQTFNPMFPQRLNEYTQKD
jgi:hypothetical protein